MPDHTTLVLLVRHGLHADHRREAPRAARRGLHLSEDGQRQADGLAERLAAVTKLGAIYASPLERARETAAPHRARARPRRPHRAGPGRARRRATGPGSALKQASPQAGVGGRPAAPERLPLPRRRVVRGDAEPHHGRPRPPRRAPSGEVVVAVSHADPIKAAVAHALGTPLDLFQRHRHRARVGERDRLPARTGGRAHRELRRRRPRRARWAADEPEPRPSSSTPPITSPPARSGPPASASSISRRASPPRSSPCKARRSRCGPSPSTSDAARAHADRARAERRADLDADRAARRGVGGRRRSGSATTRRATASWSRRQRGRGGEEEDAAEAREAERPRRRPSRARRRPLRAQPRPGRGVRRAGARRSSRPAARPVRSAAGPWTRRPRRARVATAPRTTERAGVSSAPAHLADARARRTGIGAEVRSLDLLARGEITVKGRMPWAQQRHVPRGGRASTAPPASPCTSRSAASARSGTSRRGSSGARSPRTGSRRRSAGASCRSPCRATARTARARSSASWTPTSSSTTSRCSRTRAHRDRLQRICLFDLVANNADRKSGHCLLGPDGDDLRHRQRPQLPRGPEAPHGDLGLRRRGRFPPRPSRISRGSARPACPPTSASCSSPASRRR